MSFTPQDETSTIPMLLTQEKPTGTPTALELGPNRHNLAAKAAARHPLDDLQRRRQAPHDLDLVRHVYGSGLAMQLATEQKIAAQLSTKHRLYGASRLQFADIWAGTETRVDYKDSMQTFKNPDIPKMNLHMTMERDLGM